MRLIINMDHISLFEAIEFDDMQKVSMPADPQWWQERAQSDPYVYHRTNPDYLPSIQEKGLIPWDDPLGLGRSNYGRNPLLIPRPDHSYFNMSDNKGAWDLGSNTNGSIRVRRDVLDPNLINPDEDASRMVGRQYPDANTERAITDWVHDPLAKDRGLGQGAELFNYGQNPIETQRGIDATDRMAYKGPIAPEHLEYYDANSKEYIPHSSWDNTVHKMGNPPLVVDFSDEAATKPSTPAGPAPAKPASGELPSLPPIEPSPEVHPLPATDAKPAAPAEISFSSNPAKGFGAADLAKGLGKGVNALGLVDLGDKVLESAGVPNYQGQPIQNAFADTGKALIDPTYNNPNIQTYYNPYNPNIFAAPKALYDNTLRYPMDAITENVIDPAINGITDTVKGIGNNLISLPNALRGFSRVEIDRSSIPDAHFELF